MYKDLSELCESIILNIYSSYGREQILEVRSWNIYLCNWQLFQRFWRQPLRLQQQKKSHSI